MGLDSQAKGCGFESGRPLQFPHATLALLQIVYGLINKREQLI
jgi:hypothetical protein